MVVPYQGLQVILDLKVEQKRPQIDFNVFNQMNIKFASSIQTQKKLNILSNSKNQLLLHL